MSMTVTMTTSVSSLGLLDVSLVATDIVNKAGTVVGASKVRIS